MSNPKAMTAREVIARVLTGGFESADEVIEALSAAGLVVVPREPTEALDLSAQLREARKALRESEESELLALRNNEPLRAAKGA
jgi:predicted RNA binding protein YcfA (HicA-like mRNA interferase family)